VKYNLEKCDNLTNLISSAYIFSALAIIFLTSSIAELKIKMYLKMKNHIYCIFYYRIKKNRKTIGIDKSMRKKISKLRLKLNLSVNIRTNVYGIDAIKQ